MAERPNPSTEPRSTPHALGRRLTRRYVVALALVGTVLVTGHFLLVTRLSRSETDAYVINISGMQRMLSQRVALYGTAVANASTDEVRAEAVGSLRRAVDRMAVNHEELASLRAGLLPPERVRALYFSDDALDARVKAYLDRARALTGAPAEDATVIANGLVTQQEALLEDLDGVVDALQSDAEAKLDRFRSFDVALVAFGIVVLLLEALFIFRPMVRTITRATDELTRSNRELESFTYRVSHDLRGPVQSASSLAEILDDADDAETRADVLAHLRSSIARVRSVVEDLGKLTRSRIERGTPEPVALSEIIDEVTTQIADTPGFDRVELRLEIDEALTVFAPRSSVRLLVENLVANAVQFHDPDHPTPYVRVAAHVEANACHIVVEDNGLGIPEAYRGKVFAMFERFHPEVWNGSGLGLYAVRQTAEALGGSVTYTPKAPGSAFEVVFPARTQT